MPEDLTTIIDRLDKLEKDFRDHEHLGNDGSHIFEGLTSFNGKSLLINPNIAFGNDAKGFVTAPFVITDGKSDNLATRLGGITSVTTGERDTTTEQNNLIIQTGKQPQFSTTSTKANQADWNDIFYAQTRTIISPIQQLASGPSYLPPQSFFIGSRTPQPRGYGTVSAGGSILIDSDANFVADELQFCLLTVNGIVYKIASNTANTITIGTVNPGGSINYSAFSSSGTFEYFIETPMLLGGSNIPWARLYVGEDIRFGYGSSGGTKVCYIKWGYGSPEGVISANQGSLYLRLDGGAATTLYVKQSGANGATGWVGK